MSTTPIPSALVEDFKLNVEDFDAFANGTVNYTDRFGLSRLSLSQFMESIGYEVPVAFADSLSITRVTQTVTYSGNTYHARADAIPFTTTVTFNAAQWDLIVSNPVEVSTHAATSKTTPVDADEIPLVDSAASFGLKKLTWANLKATLKTYFDTLYQAVGSYLLTTGGTMTGLLKFAAGANIASAATVNLSTATGNTAHITGTTGISAWTMTSGQFMQVIFDGVLTLTHHATNNNLPGSANIITAAGDRAFLYYDGTTTYVFQYTRADGTSVVGQRMTLTAAVATTSGTLIDITSIPSWAKRVTVEFNAVSTTGNNNYLLQLGTSSGVETTGYINNMNAVTGASISTVSSTAGILISAAAGTATTVSGSITIELQSGSLWNVKGDTIRNGDATNNKTVGNKTLSSVLDRVRITTTTAVDTFDAGSISLLIEGY